jgi:ribosomal protein S18 acetylase RimI-like enzyme
MTTIFRKAIVPDEIRSLLAFDSKVFPKADRFSKAEWEYFESYWMIVDDIKVGCCAFEKHVDFREDISEHGLNPPLPGSLYISTTGILPRFQGMGFGQTLKCWEISFARYHRFTRIVTNTRKRNVAMIRLNQKFGFKIIRTTPGYYTHPPDTTVVLELRLK